MSNLNQCNNCQDGQDLGAEMCPVCGTVNPGALVRIRGAQQALIALEGDWDPFGTSSVNCWADGVGIVRLPTCLLEPIPPEPKYDLQPDKVKQAIDAVVSHISNQRYTSEVWKEVPESVKSEIHSTWPEIRDTWAEIIKRHLQEAP